MVCVHKLVFVELVAAKTAHTTVFFFSLLLSTPSPALSPSLSPTLVSRSGSEVFYEVKFINANQIYVNVVRVGRRVPDASVLCGLCWLT